MDALARALIDLRDQSVSNSDADRIMTLYNVLHEFDKNSLTYQSVIKKPTSGRFARSKKCSGHVGIQTMKRCVVTAYCIYLGSRLDLF